MDNMRHRFGVQLADGVRMSGVAAQGQRTWLSCWDVGGHTGLVVLDEAGQAEERWWCGLDLQNMSLVCA